MIARDRRVAILSPVAWRTPPRHYGAWETVASNITEGLVARGWDVTLFATGDSLTRAQLHAVVDVGYEEDAAADPKVAEYLHIAEVFEHAAEFDLIHSHYDFMALSYSRLVRTPVLTTIHGFSSPKIMPVYEKYRDGYYVSISDADRAPGLNYLATVYNGIDLDALPVPGARRRRPDLPRPHPSGQGRSSRDRGRAPERATPDHRRHRAGRGLFPRADRAPSRWPDDPTTSGPSDVAGKNELFAAASALAAPEHHPGTVRAGAGRGQCRGRAGDRDGPRLLPRGHRGRADRFPGRQRRAGGPGAWRGSPRSTAAPAAAAWRRAFPIAAMVAAYERVYGIDFRAGGRVTTCRADLEAPWPLMQSRHEVRAGATRSISHEPTSRRRSRSSPTTCRASAASPPSRTTCAMPSPPSTQMRSAACWRSMTCRKATTMRRRCGSRSRSSACATIARRRLPSLQRLRRGLPAARVRDLRRQSRQPHPGAPARGQAAGRDDPAHRPAEPSPDQRRVMDETRPAIGTAGRDDRARAHDPAGDLSAPRRRRST